MSGGDQPHLWLADPTVSWRIGLTARLDPSSGPDTDPATLQERLSSLNEEIAGPRPDRTSPAWREAGTVERLLDEVTSPTPHPVTAGLCRGSLVVGGEHQYLDGLAMLAVVGRLIGVPVSSSARGVGSTTLADAAPFPAVVARRLWEVLVRRPARVPGRPEQTSGLTISTASREVSHRVAVADLVHAAAHTVADRARGHVSVAIGASTRSGERPVLGDHSALLRLTDADRSSLAEMRDRIRTAAPVPSPGRSLEGSASWVGRAGAVAVRLLGPRLGSSVTVSHLGEVSAPGAGLEFFPVSGGSSGVAIGAVGQEGRTRLTARSVTAKHAPQDLAEFLDDLAARLS